VAVVLDLVKIDRDRGAADPPRSAYLTLAGRKVIG
jgi:hypothetical protein